LQALSKGFLSASKTQTFVGLSHQSGFANPNGSHRNGGKLKEIRNRLKAIKSVQKITKTMKLIANARLKAAQDRMLRSRPFASGNETIFGVTDDDNSLAFVNESALVIPVTSDRGLCGAINSSVVKASRILIREKEAKGSKVSLVTIGDKGTVQLQRDNSQKILFSVGETAKRPLSFAGVGILVDKILSSGTFDSFTIIFNKFNTMISYKTTPRYLQGLPLIRKNPTKFYDFDFEEDMREQHLVDFLEFHLGTTLYNALYESSASELAGRMTAMDNATRNATDVIKRLSIAYNRGRQAAITTELTEIISGAAAATEKSKN